MSSKAVALSLAAQRKLKKAGVAVVYAFGSRVMGTSLPFSDLDIGLVMEDKQLFKISFGKLYTIVYGILSSDNPEEPDGPKLDIAFLQRANAALAVKAIQEGVILFESNAKLRADFEESVLHRYDDYRMLQYEYEEANIRAFENFL